MVYSHTFRTEHSETTTTNSMYGEYAARQREKKIGIQPALLKILQYVDSNRNKFLANLEKFIKIPSVSTKLEYVSEVQKAIKFTESWLTKLGIKYECFNIGNYELEGKKIRRPTVILGRLGKDQHKKTVKIILGIHIVCIIGIF